MKARKSPAHNRKPGDLGRGRVKGVNPLEARRGAGASRSHDPGLGVISQTSPGIAGSPRSMSKHGLRRGFLACRVTDGAIRAERLGRSVKLRRARILRSGELGVGGKLPLRKGNNPAPG